MEYTQPQLPYDNDALEPAISARTVDFHYGRHEKAYIDNLNRLIKDTVYSDMPLEEIIRQADGPLFNNASQAWNHIFYFFQFSPVGKRAPEGNLKEKIESTFGSLEDFKKKFEEAGATVFGSGWVWLSCDEDGNLFLTQSQNAGNPMTEGLRPILVFDVWEHAYYLDYQNLRASYLHALWDIVDWGVVETRYGG